MKDLDPMLAATMFILGILLGFFFGYSIQETLWKNDAERHGKAEYFLDAQHNKEWKWLP